MGLGWQPQLRHAGVKAHNSLVRLPCLAGRLRLPDAQVCRSGARCRARLLQLLLELLDAGSQAAALECELGLTPPTPTAQASCARPTAAPLPARQALCAHPLIRWTTKPDREARVRDRLSCACWSAAESAHRHCSSTAWHGRPRVAGVAGCCQAPQPAWALCCSAVPPPPEAGPISGVYLADTTSAASPKVPLPLAVVVLTSREACRSRDASCTCAEGSARGWADRT